MVYNDKKSTYENLLIRDRSVSLHVRNLQILAIEMFKVHSDYLSRFSKNSSIREHLTMNYDIRHNLQFQELKVFLMGPKV